MRWIFIGGLMAASLWGDGVDLRPKLSVQGEATLYAPADEMQVNLGVVSQEKTAEAAVSAARSAVVKVVQALGALGLDKKEWTTGDISIEPVYTRQDQGVYTPEITAYRVSQQIRIKTQKLDLAGQILDAAVKSGANQIDNLQFGTKDVRALRFDVIAQASKNAVADARTLADATGQKLVRMLEVVLNQDSFQPARRNFPVMMAKMGDSQPINPGDVAVSARVSVIYEMAP